MSISEEKFKIGTTYLLPFEKLHGLGNDFVVVNNAHLPEDSHTEYEQELTKKICDRNRGIGGDGFIVIDNVKESSEAIRSWRYYNSDGSIGEMCGNGIRCAAKYIYEHGLSGEETQFKIETLAGDIGIELLDDEMVKVDMGPPRKIEENLSLTVDNFKFDYTNVSMGNPHAIAFFDDIEAVKHHGPAIEVHKNFPNKTNVEFAQILLKKSCREKSSDTRLASSEQAELTNPSMMTAKNERNAVDEALRGGSNIKLIVWERGCGFTQACGTGACATVVAAILKGHCKKDEDITVKLPGGDLIIRWDSVAETIFMTGKAEMSFLGYYNA